MNPRVYVHLALIYNASLAHEHNILYQVLNKYRETDYTASVTKCIRDTAA